MFIRIEKPNIQIYENRYCDWSLIFYANDGLKWNQNNTNEKQETARIENSSRLSGRFMWLEKGWIFKQIEFY